LTAIKFGAADRTQADCRMASQILGTPIDEGSSCSDLRARQWWPFRLTHGSATAPLAARHQTAAVARRSPRSARIYTSGASGARASQGRAEKANPRRSQGGDWAWN